jgi:GNAT superfamily N-acetyltransferase
LNNFKYVDFRDIDPRVLIEVLNSEKVREHLMPHPLFDETSVRKWVAEKIEIDSTEGCYVRAVFIDEVPAGWCGIQKEKDDYEIAIILSDKFKGAGSKIFRHLIDKAKRFGHKEIAIHLLETRPVYKFLEKMASKRISSTISGHKFNTYIIKV